MNAPRRNAFGLIDDGPPPYAPLQRKQAHLQAQAPYDGDVAKAVQDLNARQVKTLYAERARGKHRKLFPHPRHLISLRDLVDLASGKDPVW